MKTAFVILSMLFYTVHVFAQAEVSGDVYKQKAIAAEKAGQSAQAGIDYTAAGNAYKKEADEAIKMKFTDLSIYKLLNASKESYEKAAANYKKAKKIIEETDAQKEAIQMGIRASEYGKKAGVIKTPPSKEEKPVVKEPVQIPWKPGKEISLNARKAIFAITLPEALKYTGPKVFTKATHVMLRESETLISVIGTNADPKLQFSLKEYIGDGVDREGKTRNIQDGCEGAGKEPVIIPFMGLTETRFVSIGANTKACLKTNESQQIDTKRYMFGFEMMFYYKNNGYHLSGIGHREWKTSILEMLKTFHIVGEEIPPKPCQASDEYLLENLAFEKVYKLPDENKDVRIMIEPYLARNKVSDGWHLVTQTIIDALSAYQEIGDKFDLLVNGKKAFYGKPGEFKDWVKLEITIRVLDLPDISPTNVIQGYIDVFDKTITAISGLENKISNMTVNLSWEVPYVNITTKCIPRFICVNGKMEADRKNLAYKYVGKGTQTDRQAYQNLTPNQAVEKREKVLNRFLNEIKKDAEAYGNAKDCSDFTGKLFNVRFPIAPDECARRQTELNRLEAEQKSLDAQKIDLNKRLKSHNATRQARIDERNKKIQQNEKSIEQKKTTRAQKEQLKKNYEKSNAPNKAALIKDIDEQLVVLNIQIGNMVTETIRLEWERNDLVDNKFEKELKLELEIIDDRIKKLKDELTAAQNALNNCR